MTTMEHWLANLATITRIAFETAGILVVVFGSLIALVRSGRTFWQEGDWASSIATFRSDLGRAILLGLEFLVAGDIINTVAFEPNLTSVAVLAGIVLIRTFLSFSIELEIEGRWPWQRNAGRAERTAPVI